MTVLASNMSSQLSVIIPIFRDDSALTHLLNALTDHKTAKIYIVDGENRLVPPKPLSAVLSGFRNIIWCPAPRGRGPQIAQGLQEALEDNQCQWVWVLHADSKPPPGAAQEITRILSAPEITMGMFRLSFGRRHWTYHLFEGFARFETSLTSFGDQGFFFRRSDAAALWPNLKDDLMQAPILEDMILRRAFKSRGRIKKSRLQIGTSPRRFERYGLWRTQFKNISILLRARFGVAPKQLYKIYYNSAPAPLRLRETVDVQKIAPIRS